MITREQFDMLQSVWVSLLTRIDAGYENVASIEVDTPNSQYTVEFDLGSNKQKVAFPLASQDAEYLDRVFKCGKLYLGDAVTAEYSRVAMVEAKTGNPFCVQNAGSLGFGRGYSNDGLQMTAQVAEKLGRRKEQPVVVQDVFNVPRGRLGVDVVIYTDGDVLLFGYNKNVLEYIFHLNKDYLPVRYIRKNGVTGAPVLAYDVMLGLQSDDLPRTEPGGGSNNFVVKADSFDYSEGVFRCRKGAETPYTRVRKSTGNSLAAAMRRTGLENRVGAYFSLRDPEHFGYISSGVLPAQENSGVVHGKAGFSYGDRTVLSTGRIFTSSYVEW
ncbi:MAG: hypothetical protein U0L04_04685 [Bacteroidaceae bacterium]|nr:hypothetical protein [Bacteroidaceae bacterium]